MQVGHGASGSSASARRSVSMNGAGSIPNGAAADGSVTVVGVDRPSIRGRAIAASTGVTSPIHSDESHGVSSGTGSFGRRRAPSASAIRSSISPYESTSGPPIWTSRPSDAATSGARQVGGHVVDPDRLRRGREPRRRDHRRQPLDQISQRPVGLAPGADHHPGAEVGQRRTVLGEHLRRSLATAKVPRSWLVAEPAEVDDAANALALRHSREVERAAALTLLEVAVAAATHRVDQVVGDLGTLADAAQRVRVEDVALAQLDPPIVKGRGARSVPDEHRTSHPPAASSPVRRPAHEARRPRYQRPPGHGQRLRPTLPGERDAEAHALGVDVRHDRNAEPSSEAIGPRVRPRDGNLGRKPGHGTVHSVDLERDRGGRHDQALGRADPGHPHRLRAAARERCGRRRRRAQA